MKTAIETLENLTNEDQTARRGRPRLELDMDTILAAHEDGQTAQEIAESLGEQGVIVTSVTICNRLRELGQSLKRGAPRLELTQQVITELYVDRSMTLHETAKELDISVGTLLSRMAEFDISRRPRGRRAAPQKVALATRTKDLDIAECSSYADVVRALNLPNGGFGYAKAKEYVKAHNLDVSHF